NNLGPLKGLEGMINEFQYAYDRQAQSSVSLSLDSYTQAEPGVTDGVLVELGTGVQRESVDPPVCGIIWNVAERPFLHHKNLIGYSPTRLSLYVLYCSAVAHHDTL
ncbi:hypothetical protein KUCAC02_028117, partial [Chaenocephalus aceratus]